MPTLSALGVTNSSTCKGCPDPNWTYKVDSFKNLVTNLLLVALVFKI